MSLWSSLWNTDSATGKSGTELDNELAALNQQRLDSGYYSADQYAKATANLDASKIK